jgi:asparagine synthase (glutamine-hydrolysing)
MSGIVGILNLDGEPVDRSLLEKMTEFMTFRGPDDQQVWLEGAVGFGHTMLRTTWEAEYEYQPFTLDSQVWIVADARIDDRDNLASKLWIAPLPVPPFEGGTAVITDVELILRAYLEWGDSCVEHLLGDFAFAVWDGRKQRAFCARDQFGMKLFYYSRVGNCLIFSNTLNCIRQHPRVSSELNEAAIGDFLLFGMNYNVEITTFADIQRMPSAHTLTWSQGKGLEMQRYWTLPVPELVRYQNPQDYIDRFKKLMGQAVGDRLRQEKVAIYLSGGLDSNTIAATAKELAVQKSLPLDLQAFTAVYDRSMPDRERYYVEIAARALGIPVHYCAADNYQLYEGWEEGKRQFPEPYHEPISMIGDTLNQQVNAHSRVALHGEGGDEGLKGRTVVDLRSCMSGNDLLLDIGRCLFQHRISPDWGTGILANLRHLRSSKPDTTYAGYPSWLNPAFEVRANLPERWQQIKSRPNYSVNPRSEAYYRFVSHQFTALWSCVHEGHDPSYSMVPLEVRLPFLDLRLLTYLLALPPIPWCVSKQLLRLALQNSLPEAICHRPKTPLVENPIAIRLKQLPQSPLQSLKSFAQMFVNLDALMQIDKHTCKPIWSLEDNLPAVSLSFWLDRESESLAHRQIGI